MNAALREAHLGGPLRPTEIPVRETVEFLLRALPPAPARILEVGAGNGVVACALAQRGYEVTVLDESLDRPATSAVERVRWIEADFLHYESDDADYSAVLFTRSLHHIASLEGALDRAAALVRSGGLLVAEEFAYDRVNLPTARWFYDLEAVLIATGLLARREGSEEEEGNALGRWRREHAHDPPLHGGHAMLSAIRERFETVPAEEAPYLYRYFCAGLAETAAGLETAERILSIEKRMIRERDLAAAGLRVTATAAA